MKVFSVVILLALTGCAHEPTFTDKTVTARVIITDEDLMLRGQNVYALAWPLEFPCLIIIERKHYSHEIIGHEFRHCLDGYWHE